MGIVDHGRTAVGRTHEFEPPAHGPEAAHRRQHLAAVGAQQQCGAVDGQQVRGVEPAEKSDPHLVAAQTQQHAVEVLFQYAPREVGGRPERIGCHPCTGILHHDAAVAVVGVRQGESPGGQTVEKELLGLDIGGEGLVVVEMVVGDVGEDAPFEMQAADALLHDGVRRHLHEAIGAARVDHFAHQRVEPDHVGRGMRRRDAPFAHTVDDRRNQSRLVTQPAEEVVEQRGDGGLAVGAGDAHQMQFAAGMIVEGGRHVGHRRMGVGHRDVAHPFGQRFG